MKLALITPSYLPDLNRCKLLSQTVERWVDASIDHLVIVPKRDCQAFKTLPSRSRIIAAESILPKFAWQVPLGNKWWLTCHSFPVRGWIMQQLVKLSAASCLDYDVFVFADSDIVIIRPVTSEIFVRDGKVRLYKLPGAAKGEMHLRWNRVAAQKLGIEIRDYFGADYIGWLVSWHKPTVNDMLRRIETVNRKHWFVVLANTLYFAEYLLYGIYVDFVVGDTASHFAEYSSLCHWHWYHKLDTPRNIETYIDAAKDEHLAILFQSNVGLDVDCYYDVLKSKHIIE
jgi:hypothetical protein